MERAEMGVSTMEKAGGAAVGSLGRATGAGERNTEKWESVHQKVAERFERVRTYLVGRPGLFATQGAVVATSRTYRGRRLGPYFQLAWREAGRLRRLYLGRSLELADRVRELLERLQRPARERRALARLKRQTRAALRRWLDEMRPFLAGWGVEFKGFELRGVRRSLRRYAGALDSGGTHGIRGDERALVRSLAPKPSGIRCPVAGLPDPMRTPARVPQRE
jgi:hypothetical protein